MSEQQNIQSGRSHKVLRRTALALGIVLLLVLLVLGGISALLSTDRGSRWVLTTITEAAGSETLEISYARMEGTFLHGLTLHDLHLDIDGNTIDAGQLSSRWNPFSLLSGEFILNDLSAANVTVNWQPGEPADPDEPSVPLSAMLDELLPLPISLQLAAVSLESADIRYGEDEFHVASLQFGAALRTRQLTVQDLDLAASPIHLSGDLALDLEQDLPLASTLQWRFDPQSPDAVTDARGSLTVDGDLNALTLQHQLDAPARIRSSGTLMLGLADMLNERSEAMDLEMALDHELPAQSLPLEQLEEWQLEQASVRTNGWLDALQISGEAQLRGEAMPDLVLAPRFDWRGTLSDNHFDVEHFSTRTDSGELQARGNVNWQDVPDIDLALELDESEPGAYWAGFPEEITFTGLSSQVNIRMRFPEQGPTGSVELTTLSAQLNEHALQGEGLVQLHGDETEITALRMQSGENALQLSGRLGEMIEARFDLDAADIAALYPAVTGRLNVAGTVSGTMENLQVEVEGRGDELHYETFGITELILEASTREDGNRLTVDLHGLRAGEETIDQLSLQLSGQPDAHQLQLALDGEPGQVSLEARGGLQDSRWVGELLTSTLDSSLVGSWQQVDSTALEFAAEQSRIDESCWRQGETTLCLQGELDGEQQLEASLSLNDYPLTVLNAAEAEEIVRNYHEGSLPAQYQQPPAGVALPAQLPIDTALIGQLDAQASISGAINALEQLQLQFNATMNDGALYLRPRPAAERDEEDTTDPLVEQFVWENAQLEGTLDSGDWQFSSRMDLHQQDIAGTGIAMRGQSDADLAMDAEGNLDGELRLDFDDMAWIEALVPQLRDVRGELNGAFAISGTRGSPAIGADLALSEAGFSVPVLGLELTEVAFSLQDTGPETFELQGSARSGEGLMNIRSEILRPFQDSRELTLNLDGNNFLLADLPDTVLRVTPSLRVTASTSGIHLSGNLFIPMLDVHMTRLPETAVDVSSDTVVRRQPADREQVRNAAVIERGVLADIPLTGEFRVRLGNEVRFSGFGLDAQLQGMLDITQRANAAPLAYGELEVIEGSFETYGRTLIIEQGKLLFFGGLDNPAIDIRAVRQVENMTVGVQMNGTLRNIRSRLFSNPTLPDGDIVAVLITGRPLAEVGTQQEGNALVGAVTTLGINQGEPLTNQIRSQLGLDTLAIDSRGDVQDSRLTLGKYITPRIFVRYAVGLFETENTLAIDYTVTDNIKLEAKSGQTQSVDLTYTLER